MLRYVAGTALAVTILTAVPLAPASADQGRHAALGLGLLGGAVAGAAIAGAQSGPGGHSSEGSTVVVQQQPVYVAPYVTPYVAPSAGAYYYYCSYPQGYYPYVGMCQTPWQMVPVTPSVAPPPPAR